MNRRLVAGHPTLVYANDPILSNEAAEAFAAFLRKSEF